MNKIILWFGWVLCMNVLHAQDTIVMPSTGNGGFYNTCYAVILDSGIDSNYTDDNHSTLTIAPLWVQNVRLYFESFDTEIHFDSLTIYDGPGTTFPRIGTYSGNQLQGQMVQSTGSSITLEFRSDDIVTGAGFKAWVSCEVGVEEELKQEVILYPNPANTFMQVMGLDGSTIERISIQDETGRIKKVGNVVFIDVQDLSPGFYTLAIELKNSIIHKKFLKY